MPSLVAGEITSVLFGREDPDEFHWTICIAFSAHEVKKLHVKNVGRGNWFFEDPPPVHSLLYSNTLAADVKIGQVNMQNFHNEYNAIVDLLRAIQIPVIPAVDKERERKFTCRVWWRQAIRVLHNSGYINCPDVDLLESECKSYGAPNHPAYSTWRGYRHFIARSSA